jgi:hypothetical protein
MSENSVPNGHTECKLGIHHVCCTCMEDLFKGPTSTTDRSSHRVLLISRCHHPSITMKSSKQSLLLQVQHSTLPSFNSQSSTPGQDTRALPLSRQMFYIEQRLELHLALVVRFATNCDFFSWPRDISAPRFAVVV